MKAVKKTVPEKRRFPAGELFAAVLLLAATLFGCFFLFSKGENKKQTAQTAMLTQTPGLRVLSENPAPVVNGEARFSVETEEGYRFADLGGGILDGTVLTFRAAVGNSYTVTLAHPVALSLADSERGELYFVREDVPSGDSVSGDSVSGGTAEALPDRTLVRYTNETVTLRGRSAEPEHYSFCGVTADGVLYPAGDDGAVRAEFPCDSRIEPVFLGREVAVRISVGLRGSVTEGDGGERESAVYRYGESLPLRAEFDGRVCRFLGWSRKGYLRDGGELVSKELAYELELLGDVPPDSRAAGEYYRAILSGHDCVALLRLCKTLHAKQNSQTASHRGVNSTELRSWRMAEEMLYGEFGFALGMPPAQVRDFLREKLGG